MADQGYYYGWEVEVRLAVETTYGTASVTGGEYIHPTYVRGIGWNLNENVEMIYTANNTYRMNHGDEVKGMKQATANMSFWMADDFGASGVEPLLAKLAIDQYNNSSGAGPYVYDFPEDDGTFPGDSAYGSYSLMPFTIEVAWNKSGDIRGRKILGSYVNRETFRAARGEKCEWSWEIVAQDIQKITSITGSGSKTTYHPLDWSHVSFQWKGEDDSLSSHTGLLEIEWTIDNQLVPLLDLNNSAGDREVNDFLMEKRSIAGTMTVYKQDDTGQKWFEIVASATAAQTEADNTIQLGQIKITLNSKLDAGNSLVYDLYDVIIGELPEDVDFEKLTELSLPFSARYIQGVLTTSNTASLWTNWDSQAS